MPSRSWSTFKSNAQWVINQVGPELDIEMVFFAAGIIVASYFYGITGWGVSFAIVVSLYASSFILNQQHWNRRENENSEVPRKTHRADPESGA